MVSPWAAGTIARTAMVMAAFAGLYVATNELAMTIALVKTAVSGHAANAGGGALADQWPSLPPGNDCGGALGPWANDE